jgi:hypothetical protein
LIAASHASPFVTPLLLIMKKRFYLYTSWQESISLLSTEEQAQMLHNFFNYAKGEEPVLNTPGLKLVWAGMKFLLEQDHEKYCGAVERARGTKKKNMEPYGTVKESMVPYDNVNDNVNDNDNVDENDRVTAETAVDKFNRLMNQ